MCLTNGVGSSAASLINAHASVQGTWYSCIDELWAPGPSMKAEKREVGLADFESGFGFPSWSRSDVSLLSILQRDTAGGWVSEELRRVRHRAHASQTSEGTCIEFSFSAHSWTDGTPIYPASVHHLSVRAPSFPSQEWSGHEARVPVNGKQPLAERVPSPRQQV